LKLIYAKKITYPYSIYNNVHTVYFINFLCSIHTAFHIPYNNVYCRDFTKTTYYLTLLFNGNLIYSLSSYIIRLIYSHIQIFIIPTYSYC